MNVIPALGELERNAFDARALEPGPRAMRHNACHPWVPVLSVTKPIAPTSATQELLWSSPNFFAIPGLNFTDYTLFFMKKNAQGAVQNLGSVRISFRLPSERLGEGLSGSITGFNGKTISYMCGQSVSAPSGYQSYRYSSDNCYYKFN